jgi:hypothetical protein
MFRQLALAGGILLAGVSAASAQYYPPNLARPYVPYYAPTPPVYTPPPPPPVQFNVPGVPNWPGGTFAPAHPPGWGPVGCAMRGDCQ